jgi:phenylpropionate dioxygenase-like ring-hydroxylating dioxygenase large terminal subunit
MSQAQLVAMAKRNLAHVKAESVDQADGVYRVPAAHYYDPERWQLEMDRLFKRLPLVLGFSAELRQPGDYRAMLVADVPVLLTRSAEGEVHGFLNVCSHRGAIVVPEGSGHAHRFTCPYHGWSYDERGRLTGIRKAVDFGDVDRSCLGLTPLPVRERAGLVFGAITPNVEIDFDAFLCGYDELLAHHRLGDCHLVGRQVVDGPNWKLAYDGYLDFYHLPVLHKDSFGSKISCDALYDAWGPHQRVSTPNPAYRELEQKPEQEWDPASLLSGVWTIFPHVSIADFDAGGKLYMVSQLFPGATPDESITVQNFLTTTQPDTERQTQIESTMRFLEHVVRDEDYEMGKRIQQALKTGAKSEVLFGRNEGGGQRFHRWLDALLASDEDSPWKLFARGIEAAE